MSKVDNYKVEINNYELYGLHDDNRLMRNALRDIIRLTQRVMLPIDGDTVGWELVATKRMREIRKLACDAHAARIYN